MLSRPGAHYTASTHTSLHTESAANMHKARLDQNCRQPGITMEMNNYATHNHLHHSLLLWGKRNPTQCGRRLVAKGGSYCSLWPRGFREVDQAADLYYKAAMNCPAALQPLGS